MLPLRARVTPRALTIASALAVLVTFESLFRPYFPNPRGEIAGDYAYYFPRLYDGALWFKANGLFSVPWFTPSFCGGTPAYPNPQSAWFALPQLLDLAFGPMVAVHTTVVAFAAVGFVGFHLLLRRVFAVGRPAAVFGAALFTLNGFYLWRMVAGHLSFHPFTLVPFVAWATLRPLAPAPLKTQAAALVGDACLAGAAVGYALHAGAVQIGPPAAFAVIAIAALRGLTLGTGGREACAFVLRFAGGALLALGIAAGKLASAFAFLSQAQRALYPLPGVRTASDLTELVLIPLLARPRMTHLGGAIVNTPWKWSMSEFELGIGPAPLLLLLGAAVVGIVGVGLRLHRHGPTRGARTPGLRRLGHALVLIVLLALPLYLNVYDPSLGTWMKTLPLLRSMHALFRFLSIYVPVFILAGALVLDRIRVLPIQVALAFLGVALLVAQDRQYDPEYGGGYVAAPIVLAHQELARTRDIPSVDRLAPVALNTGADLPAGEIAGGVSTWPCYEPMFGYALEAFPRTALHAGPVGDVTDHAYNLLDPSCFVYPGQNGCSPGDRMRDDDPSRFEAFRAHRPLTFVMPWWQKLANVASLITVAVVGLALVRRLSVYRG